jgi:hypothetical protein
MPQHVVTKDLCTQEWKANAQGTILALAGDFLPVGWDLYEKTPIARTGLRMMPVLVKNVTAAATAAPVVPSMQLDRWQPFFMQYPRVLSLSRTRIGMIEFSTLQIEWWHCMCKKTLVQYNQGGCEELQRWGVPD